MTLLIPTAIAVFFLLLIIHEVRQDGRGTRPPPSSHYEDPAFLPPSARR